MADPEIDICASECFRRYIRDFRDSHPLDRELAAKYGFLTEIGDSNQMTQSTRGTFSFGGTA